MIELFDCKIRRKRKKKKYTNDGSLVPTQLYTKLMPKIFCSIQK